MVKYPEIQEKLVKDIRDAVAGEREELETKVKKEDLMRLPYLKAVVLEGLRRHPPGHFVSPHAVSEAVILTDLVVPKNGTINFNVAQLGLDPEVWEDPMEFKPERVVEEIREVMGERERDKKEVKEEDLNRLSYLKAVILERLRLHPPGLPHAASEDVALGDYLVPKYGVINFMVADMGRDPKVREDPLEFKPERLLNSDKNGGESFDITGCREMKMMPFKVGRRMYPGFNLAMLLLEYFAGNLIWNFEWKSSSSDGDVDLSEKDEFTTVMKYPLQVYLAPRI